MVEPTAEVPENSEVLGRLRGLAATFSDLPERSHPGYFVAYDAVLNGLQALLDPLASELVNRAPEGLHFGGLEHPSKRLSGSPVRVVDWDEPCICGGTYRASLQGMLIHECDRCGRIGLSTCNPAPPVDLVEADLVAVPIVARLDGQPATALVQALRKICPEARDIPLGELLSEARESASIYLGEHQRFLARIWNRESASLTFVEVDPEPNRAQRHLAPEALEQRVSGRGAG